MSEPPYAPEPPADGDRAQQNPPRYAASASVPVPPQPGPPPAGGTTYGAGTYGQPAGQPPAGQPQFGQPPFGQPPAGAAPVGQPPAGQPPVGQPPAGQPPAGAAPVPQPPGGQPRVAGSASVPGPTTYGAPPAPATYGAPPAGGTYGSPAAPPAPYGPPPAPATYGGPPAGGTYGSPAAPPAPYGPPPGQFEGQRYEGQQGQRMEGQRYGGGTTYGGPSMPPPGDSGYGERPPAPANKPRKGLIAVIVVAAVILVAGVGAFVGLKLKASGGAQFAVDTCVLQQGDTAVETDCSTEGAYRIVADVRSQTLCQDARQPWLEIDEGDGTKSYRCLAPATAPEDEDEGATDPSAEASEPAADESPAAS